MQMQTTRSVSSRGSGVERLSLRAAAKPASYTAVVVVVTTDLEVAEQVLSLRKTLIKYGSREDSIKTVRCFRERQSSIGAL